jgi:hypothetical protein
MMLLLALIAYYILVESVYRLYILPKEFTSKYKSTQNFTDN